MSDTGGLFLGLISGTSADAIDVALVQFDPQPQLLASLAAEYPQPLRARVLALARDRADISLDELGSLDTEIGHAFAQAALTLIEQHQVSAQSIRAIGSHGQTVRHRPGLAAPYTLQLGDPNIIAERTGITTVGDFRRRDMAAGGQAAPLVPAFHAALLQHSGRNRVVLNLGGIANLTILPADRRDPVRGFDTGPANCLLDAWSLLRRGIGVDRGGAWATSGRIDEALLAQMLAEPYFSQQGPKSSGREVFNLDWLQRHLHGCVRADADVQATLLALTSHSVAAAIRRDAANVEEVLVCGGGVHNTGLMQALADALSPTTVVSTAIAGVDPDYVEAMTFAWLAMRRLAGLPGNVPEVTGARGARVLGAVYFGS